MAGVNNNLYPPLFKESYIPAFGSNECRIYFSISEYNNLDEIYSLVQITVQNQKTNHSVLKPSLYPSGIKLAKIEIDETRQDDKYLVKINTNDIAGGFKYNQYYKVQLRFATNKVQKIEDSTPQKLDRWLSTNLSNFSQWSTVVLIKHVGVPTISLNSFLGKGALTTITTNDLTIVGKVFHAVGDYEPFKDYRILIYNANKNIVQDSGEKYFKNSNQINYNCKYKFPEGEYSLKIKITTKNLYTTENDYNFEISYVSAPSFDAQIVAYANNDIGCITVSISNNVFAHFGTNIIITRASSKDNFTYWEDMYTTLIVPNEVLKLTWRDYTIESGVWYKYAISTVDEYNFRSVPVETKNPVMAVFEDIFLTTKNQQLKIRFDPQVNNYSRVVSQSLTETIGSKYPFIRRNGNVNYRTFSISGIITYFSDIKQNLMKASRTELYGQSSIYYEEYNNSNNIMLYKDVIQEKAFREKVLDFLYENNVKLYKSATQGNILVKLMNITLTPNNDLGRQIYSFNCSVYEIDEFNYENCIKYKIQDIGKFVKQDEFLISRFGQIVAPSSNLYYSSEEDSLEKRSVLTEDTYYFGNKNFLTTKIKEKFLNLETDDIAISIKNIYYLKITLTSNPYLITTDSQGKPYRVNDLSRLDRNKSNTYLGYIVNINGNRIIINKDGIYELSDPDTNITSFSFVYPNEQGIVDFLVNIIETPKKAKKFKNYTSLSKVGQLWGSFSLLNNSSELLYPLIANKYNIYEQGYEQQLQKIDAICIQAAPGTAFFIRQNQDKRYQQHVLNETGLLEFNNEETDIRGLYILGPTLVEATAEEIEKEGLKSYEFYDTNEVISLSVIKNPKNNYVYSVSPFQKTEEDTLVVDEDQLSIEDFEELTDWLEEQERNLLWSTNNQEAEELDLETLGLFFLSADKYIFYHGAWYPFTEDHIVIVPTVQAIIDYHCKLLIKNE